MTRGNDATSCIPISTAFLVVGLVLTGATQFRFGGLPVGPGELLLVAWLGLEAFRQLLSDDLRVSAALRRLAAFWTIFVIALCVGMIVSLIRDPFHDLSGIARDTFAYLFAILLSAAMAMALSDPVRRRRTVWAFLVVGSLSMTLQIADGMGAFSVPGLDPWYWDRMRGWAENPNQLGLVALVLVLFSLHLLDGARGGGERALAMAVATPPFAAGLLSLSDSFQIGLILSGGLYLVLKSVDWVRNSEMAPTLRGASVVLCLMLLPLAVIAAMPFASAALARIEEGSRDVYENNEQGETRLLLWREAVGKATETGFLGNGPGPHLTSKSWKRPPPDKFEAHNTILDLTMQAGLIGVAAFLWLAGTALFGAARSGRAALAGVVVGLMVFSMFHFVVRHPIFWFSIIICLLETAPLRRSDSAPPQRVRLRGGIPLHDRALTPDRAFGRVSPC